MFCFAVFLPFLGSRAVGSSSWNTFLQVRHYSFKLFKELDLCILVLFYMVLYTEATSCESMLYREITLFNAMHLAFWGQSYKHTHTHKHTPTHVVHMVAQCFVWRSWCMLYLLHLFTLRQWITDRKWGMRLDCSRAHSLSQHNSDSACHFSAFLNFKAERATEMDWGHFGFLLRASIPVLHFTVTCGAEAIPVSDWHW